MGASYVMMERKVYKGKVLDVGAPAPKEWHGKPFTKMVKDAPVDKMVKDAPADKAGKKKKGGKK